MNAFKPMSAKKLAGWVAAVLILLTVGSPSHGQTVRNLTSFPGESYDARRIALDDAGSVVYTVSSTNQFGTNPRYSWQIFRWDPASGTGSQVTSFARGVEFVSVSDDGQWLAFVSCSDLVGSNHDGSLELYVMRQDGIGLVQLTNDPAFDAGTVYEAMIAGSGNRVAFVADTDPLGTNLGRQVQIFVVNRDGTGLRQLTSGSAPSGVISISDDGNRIVFLSSGDLTGENPSRQTQVFGIDADGTGLRQITDLQVHASYATLSGDGTSVAFRDFETTWRIRWINWDGSGLVEIVSGSGSYPSITDDGQTIVYHDPAREIWKIRADGTGNTQLTNGAPPDDTIPVISGDGSRIVFRSYGGEYPGGNNPDGGYEMIAMDSAGGNLRQLTLLVAAGHAMEPAITDDGTRVFFEVSGYNIFRIQSDGTDLAQVTDLTGWYPWQFSPFPDGTGVVFSTISESGDTTNDIFKINADGTGMTQLTPFGSESSQFPVVSSDGQWVVFQSKGLVAGTNVDGSLELFRMRMDGTNLYSITADDDNPSYGDNDKTPRLADGSFPWIVYQSGSNKDGLNPDGSLEIFRVRISAIPPPQRLTADPVYESTDPDISGNGNLVVYASAADPLGTNPEHNYEIFLYDVPTATRRQLTFTTSGGSGAPRISRDGAWVYFLSGAPFFEPNPNYVEPYRLLVATGVVERMGGTRCCGADAWDVAVSRTGTRAVFSGTDDWNGQNPDLFEDIFLVDFAARPMIRVGKSSPTLLTWDPEPKPLRYDVIRGDVANLQPGAGNTVDLGPVTCLEDDSPDTNTAGFEDAVSPFSGQAFFYLYRGTQGVYDGPGSFGQGSAGKERVAGSSGCSP